MFYSTCVSIANYGAHVREITRDYTMIVCPDVVNFGGAAAYGTFPPGTTSWYRSRYASAPIVQMHELGHNLGHHHSGKDLVTYKDPTCNMGNRGSWSDAGSNFCFNAAKTWANKWYEEYHVTVDPSSGGYDGTLVGINAVKDRTITATGQDVVIKVDSPGETDLYIIYNRQTGANNQVPENGDQVVIVEQGRELRTTSSWRAALSEGQEYTQGGWSGASTLIVKVCSLETGTPGSVRVLVYAKATGQEKLSCSTSTVPVTLEQVIVTNKTLIENTANASQFCSAIESLTPNITNANTESVNTTCTFIQGETLQERRLRRRELKQNTLVTYTMEFQSNHTNVTDYDNLFQIWMNNNIDKAVAVLNTFGVDATSAGNTFI
jgi:hypothetical protein